MIKPADRLLDNAIRHMPDDGEISVGPARECNKMRVAVSDTCAGSCAQASVQLGENSMANAQLIK